MPVFYKPNRRGTCIWQNMHINNTLFLGEKCSERSRVMTRSWRATLRRATLKSVELSNQIKRYQGHVAIYPVENAGLPLHGMYRCRNGYYPLGMHYLQDYTKRQCVTRQFVTEKRTVCSLTLESWLRMYRPPTNTPCS